jgi:hypothetical protein
MKVREIRGWPPQWESFDPGKIAIGEVGVLKGASHSGIKGELHLLMEHEDSRYRGVLTLDERLSAKVLETLTRASDKPLTEIGALEIH